MTRRTFVRWFFYRARGDSPAKRSVIHLVLIIACILSVYPALRVVSVSIRPGNRVLSTDLALIPQGATFDAYATVVRDRDFLLWIWNSLAITIATSLIGVIIASTAAYGFSRWSFPGRTAGLIGLLTTQMIPAPMLMIPLYILAARLNLINTWRGLVVAYSVSAIPFSIWILKGYYDTIPVELEQSAMIDGASRMGAYYRVILPLSAPSLAIAFLFNFTSSWNEYLLARIILQKKEMLTWTLGLRQMQGQFQTQWAEFSAAALMISIPVMALFFYSSKWLVSGLTLGSVKE
ncbi:MAG TPA: sugar ABC transporter permease [Spirochaetia bacterium]|nr:sugar ABC transporter permease [Spirochaetia bacterium]